jgi:hypothetical protein
MVHFDVINCLVNKASGLQLKSREVGLPNKLFLLPNEQPSDLSRVSPTLSRCAQTGH